jgi:hypothetical protein
MLTASSDMRARFWDINYPANSFIMAPAALDPGHQPSDPKITSELDEKKCSNFENPPFLALYMSNITIFKPNYSR